jgi:hypothetical protein
MVEAIQVNVDAVLFNRLLNHVLCYSQYDEPNAHLQNKLYRGSKQVYKKSVYIVVFLKRKCPERQPETW